MPTFQILPVTIHPPHCRARQPPNPPSHPILLCPTATGEIGVPPYFAKRLSYPERVTAWNVEEMRTAVRNGASVHPGAIAVEDELGRVISLVTLTPEVCVHGP